MHIHVRMALLTGTSLFALALPAAAQDAAEAETVVLDEVVLTATTGTKAAADGYVATYSQIATKSDIPLAETQQSIAVVTNQQIRDQGAENLGQALGYTAGVLAEPFGKDPRFDTPYVRGFRAEHGQYVNGLRQGRYFGAIKQELYGMQQIEVLRGPSSSLYGAGSPQGVINMVQKRAQAYDFGEAGLGFDSNGSQQLFFDMNRAPSDVLAWRLTGIGRDDSTQIEDLTNKGGYLAGALRWTPDDATTIDFLLTYTNDAPMPPTGVPFALTGTGHDKRLRELYTGQKDWDDSDRKSYSIGVEFSHAFDNGWTLSQGFRYEKLDWDYRTTYASAVNGATTFSRGSSEQLESSETISLDTRLNGQVTTGAMTHNLLFGADVRKYDAHESSQFFTAADLDWRNPEYNIDARTPYAPANAGPSLLRQAGIYAQDEIEAGNWRGSVGLRYDWVKQTGERYGSVSEYKENKVTGRAGLAYVFDNGMMPYVSYSTSFDPQAGLDIDNNVLRPTKGRQWEAGVKYQPQSFKGLISLAVYDLRQTNVNRTVDLPDGEGSGIRQIGEVRSQGIELEATAELAEGWKIRGGYAYNKTEQKAPAGDVLDGNELADAPRHLASLWLDRDFGNGLRIGGGVRYLGSRYRNAENTDKLDSVTLVDLGGSYTYRDVEASINVSNLTDEVYVGACGFSYCSYGEGRTVQAKLTYKW
ncbi:TonB-dependent siderophore receptor [Paracoccus kondratievae]|uniref:TonB-dependent siderophore receptor n=1 Tax=Paracoccus kondratievae TaxID=135740 RepID=UPI0012665B37|nr:TonB-dependent siderophore receptor [Paracoccus kondratievae]QFQ88783.1 TonB-dependent siderophore receptor [Paracoccus kondratievae]